MGKLRDQMQADLQLRGLSPKTQKIYLGQVRDFARYFGKSPDQLGEEEVKGYLLYIIKERKASGSTINQCYNALRFLYRTTLKQNWVVEKIPYPKSKKKLPVVLDRTEVDALFSVTKNLKHKAILMIMYSSGLRLSETAHLKVSDIDSKRMMVRIQQSKGGKDRYSILSNVALGILRQYYRQYRPKEWLFEGESSGKPISERSIQYI